MKHLILGQGNLGHSLKAHLGDEAEFFNHIIGTVWPNIEPYDVIWYCIGAGSVAEAKHFPDVAMQKHLQWPLALARKLRPDQKLVTFSSDYAEQFQLSHYAMSKYFMELALEKFPNTYCYRVSSLYGTTKPWKTFPGKILTRLFMNDEIRLSRNMVLPTPTDWLAEKVWDHVQNRETRFAYIVPNTGVQAVDWARWVFDELHRQAPEVLREKTPRVDTNYFNDPERPMEIMGRSRYGTDAFGFWNADYLWGQHGPKLIAELLKSQSTASYKGAK